MENKKFNLDELVNELKEPKQKFEMPPEPEPGQETGTTGNDTGTPENAGKQESANIYKVVGTALFYMVDTPLVLGASMLADEPVTKLKLPKETRDYLVEAYTSVAKAYGWQEVPPWLVLLFVGGSAYGSVFWQAWQIRKEKNKAEQVQNTTNNTVKPKLKVVKNTGNAGTKGKTDNNTGNQRNGEKHSGGNPAENSKKGTDNNS